ncbi:MAG: GNAT family N-acetyltransferase [Candidatus Thorarchaeota archaeon]|nr:GNAT family N-acetyltransferase [Candidatus Thorarchaeota archaeon]
MFEGKLMRLVVLEGKHLDHLVENWNNPVMRRFLGGVIPHSRQSEADWLQSVQDDMKRQKMFVFAIERLSNDAFLGTLAVHDIDWIARNGRLGVVIHKPENWGKGYGTEAMELLIDFCWKHINLRRLELGVHSFNQRAKKFYLKLGFVEYGTAHQQFYIDGEYVDTIMMELFRPETKDR